MPDLKSTLEEVEAVARVGAARGWSEAPVVARRPEELLTARELGLILKVSAKTIYRLAWSGDLPAVRISRKCIRFVWSEVEEWLNGRRSLD